MKKNLLNLNFDFVFALCVVVCLLLPYMVMAKTPKVLKVTIVNNDTTINGKNIKHLSVTDRRKARLYIDSTLKGNK
jgi:hypothetical protein